MTASNKYILRSKISEAKTREFIRLFVVDLSATQISQATSLNRNTVNRILAGIRERIAGLCARASPVVGDVEVDESYFGARRVKGVRGRGARGQKQLFLASSSGIVLFILRSCQTVQKPLYRVLLLAVLI